MTDPNRAARKMRSHDWGFCWWDPWHTIFLAAPLGSVMGMATHLTHHKYVRLYMYTIHSDHLPYIPLMVIQVIHHKIYLKTRFPLVKRYNGSQLSQGPTFELECCIGPALSWESSAHGFVWTWCIPPNARLYTEIRCLVLFGVQSIFGFQNENP